MREPTSYHEPPPLVEPVISTKSVGSTQIEHLEFDSGYEPRPGEPGRARWLSHVRNRRGHAWVLRHADGNRPWLVCVHGWRMGAPAIDLAAFRAEKLHRDLGFNVLLPVLPLHGPRATGWSGADFLAGDALSTVHAMAQAMWDVRRILSWIRSQGPTAVGAYGLSLGGYTVALRPSSTKSDGAMPATTPPLQRRPQEEALASPSRRARDARPHGRVSSSKADEEIRGRQAVLQRISALPDPRRQATMKRRTSPASQQPTSRWSHGTAIPRRLIWVLIEASVGAWSMNADRSSVHRQPDARTPA